MGVWTAVIYPVIGILCMFIGYLFGAHHQKVSQGLSGMLIIDKVQPEANGGVYFQAFVDPQTFADRQRIVLEVVHFTEKDLVRSSQENQGT